jgi:hypothetical protein
VKRVTSSVVSGRRKARCPNCWISWVAQAAPSPVGVQGMTLARAVASPMTCTASAAAAVW